MNGSTCLRAGRASLLLAAGFVSSVVPAQPSASSDLAQAAHARGVCGSLGPGTGLVHGKGWIVSMLPGTHDLRMFRGGAVYLTAARLQSWSFDAGRPYYITVEGANPDSVLQWKVPGKGWVAVPTTFLYPPQGVSYAR